jgi:hypothetical protein
VNRTRPDKPRPHVAQGHPSVLVIDGRVNIKGPWPCATCGLGKAWLLPFDAGGDDIDANPEKKTSSA